MQAATATSLKTLRRHYGNPVARRLKGRPLCLASVRLQDGEAYLLDTVHPQGELTVFRLDSSPKRRVTPDQVASVFVPAELG